MNPSLEPSRLVCERQGALLLNLGTPDQPQPKEVRSYLKEFLMDPYVIDIPYLFRWLVVHGAILPKRPKLSAAAYQKVWTNRGSPLLYHLEDLTQRVATELGDGWTVLPGMRYGNPNLKDALKKFHEMGIRRVVVLPLYPQYSLAATESSIQECLRVSRQLQLNLELLFVPAFFEFPPFIQAFAQVIRDSLKDYSYDHLLFSFHGLPERQLKKLDCGAYCLVQKECCEAMSPFNSRCYRAQCFRTAKLLGEALRLPPEKYSVCFQSRLGKTPWIQPFTDELYRTLSSKGIKRLAVACPAFVADCLETLEEVQIRGCEEFVKNGGSELKLIPSLNSTSLWTQAVVQLIKRSIEAPREGEEKPKVRSETTNFLQNPI